MGYIFLYNNYMPEQSENIRHPERLSTFKELTGLQARLLIGNDYLNPSVEVGEIRVLTPNVSPDVAQKIDDKSTRLRDEYWRKKVETGEVNNNSSEQTELWKRDITNRISNTENKRVVQGLRSFFGTLEINVSNFDNSQAQILYDRYFKPDEDGHTGGFSKFKQDVISSYKDGDGSINYDRLKSDLSSIQWLSTIFGVEINDTQKETFLAELISQAISAEARVVNNSSQFIDEANAEENSRSRVNRLNTHEKELLAYLIDKQLTVTSSPHTPKPVKPHQKPRTKDRKQSLKESPETHDTVNFYEDLPNIASSFYQKVRNRLKDIYRKNIFVSRQSEITIRDPEIGMGTTLPLNTQDVERSIENDWFMSADMNLLANTYNLPLVFLRDINAVHQLLLLKIEVRNDRYGFVYYNPQKHEEIWKPFKSYLSFQEYRQQYLQEGIESGRIKKDVVVIDGEEYTQYYYTEDRQSNIKVPEYSISTEWLYYNYMYHLFEESGYGYFASENTDSMIMRGTYDLTLNNLNLPEPVADNLKQVIQFDGKNCTLASFFMGAVRYALKPAVNVN